MLEDEISRVVRPGGKAICFGWDSTGIGKTRHFELRHVLVMCHGACHKDTIITVETKMFEVKYAKALFYGKESGYD